MQRYHPNREQPCVFTPHFVAFAKPCRVCNGPMSLDDRDYYREELAQKRGVRAPAPFGQRTLSTTPMLDGVIAAQSVSPSVSAPVPMSEPTPAAPEPTHAGRPHRAILALRRLVLRRPARRRWLSGAVIALVVGGTVLAVPPVLTPRCSGLDTWQHEPVACWRYSWSALVARIDGNMAATRGWPFIIVRTERPVIAVGKRGGPSQR
jgi:hypothetical protein